MLSMLCSAPPAFAAGMSASAKALAKLDEEKSGELGFRSGTCASGTNRKTVAGNRFTTCGTRI
jgi:hypothetical protein